MNTNGVKAMQKSGGVIQYLIGLSFAPPTNTAQLVAHDLIWFNDLKNEFRVNEPLASETDPVKVKAKSEIHLIVGKKEEDLVGQDLADLETWLIELLPLEALKQKVNSLREDLQDLAGDAAWKKILPTLANQVATATEGQLRPEARRLQQELHWRTSIQPQAQNTRLKLMFRVIAMFAPHLDPGLCEDGHLFLHRSDCHRGSFWRADQLYSENSIGRFGQFARHQHDQS